MHRKGHSSAPNWPNFARLAPLLAIAGFAACRDPNMDEGDAAGTSGTESGDVDTESESGDGDGDGSGDGDGDDGPVLICDPGETRCIDEETLEVCAPTGLAWNQVPCEGHAECDPHFTDEAGATAAACVGPCDRLAKSPSSQGCSFYTTGLYQAGLPFQTPPEEYPPDAIVIGNPQTVDATVELRWVPFGSNLEQVVQGPVTIPPGGSHVFELDPFITIYLDKDPESTSDFRSGLVYHAVSDLPVVAYLHAPYEGQNSNGSTLLLPENTLQKDYVVYHHSGGWVVPNYFTVIAVENQTTVSWRPTVETAGDALPLPFLEAGELGSQLLNRFDNMRIQTSAKYDRPKCEQDLSGTIIEADKPIWVVSAMIGLRIPYCGSAEIPGCTTIVDEGCNFASDFAMEQNLPLDYWGREYVGPHAPLRGTESHHWRIFAGEHDVTVTVTPAQPDTPIVLAERGDWFDLVVEPGTHLEFDGDGAFMPVQYVTNHYPDANDKGSPAMVQMVPTAQFLDRYVFVTGFDYPEHYVQVIRAAGAADVLLDGAAVESWEAVGEWEVATILISEGAHEVVSEDSFGIMQYGYSPQVGIEDNSAGYAYMGGMKAETIYIP